MDNLAFNINRDSLLDATLTRMAEKSNKDSFIARLAQEQEHDHPLARLGMAFTKLRTIRSVENKRSKETGEPPQIVCKPEAVVGFTQKLVNNCAWSAYALLGKLNQADDWDELSGNTGTDCYADACDDYGIDPTHPSGIEDILLADLMRVEMFYSKLKAKTSYLNSHDDLYLYHDKMPDPDREDEPDAPWITKRTADTLAEALVIMEDIIAESDENNEAGEMQEWANIAA